MKYTDAILKDIAHSLTRIANALEKQNEPKGVIPNWGNLPNFNIADCVSKEEIPLPTPWNGDYKPTCKSDNLTNELYS
jgi:hypothetical protein